MESPTVGGQQVPPIQQRTVGPYHVMAQLGLSPLGPVYLARLAHKETLFALKLLPSLPPDEMARLRQDAQLLAKTDHPGIVRPADLGVDRGRVYVVSEHVPGTTLREQLDRRGPMAPRQAALVAADVADALQVAHDAGVVHRHLDLATVVVDGRDGRAKLQDYGLTRDPRRPGPPGQAPFLPAGWSPEQVRGERADARADVYALGAVLYELLTGSPPFEGHSWAELSQEILAGDPEPPGDLAPGVPRALERVCLEALSSAPDDRPTAGELAADLRRAAEGAARGGSPLVAIALGVVALAGTGGGVAWALSERDAGAALAAELAAVTSRAQLTEADLQARLGSAEAKARADQTKINELGDRGRRLQEELDRARTNASQQAATLAQAQAQVRAMQDRAGEGASLSGGSLIAPIDALLVALEEVEGSLVLRARLLRARRRDEDLLKLIAAARARGPLPPALALLEVSTFEGRQGDQAKADELRKALAGRGADDPYAMYAALAQEAQTPVEGPEAIRRIMDQGKRLGERAAKEKEKDPELLLFAARVVSAMALGARDQAAIQQAIALFDQAVAAAPLDPTPLSERSRYFTQLFGLTGGRQRDFLTRALADARVSREILPIPAAWLEVGQIQLNLGATDQAAGEFLEARRRAEQTRDANTQAGARVLLGVTRMLSGDENGAVNAWLETMQALPQAPATYGFLQFVSQLTPGSQQKLMNALPRDVRAQLEAAQRQGGGGQRPPGPNRPR